MYILVHALPQAACGGEGRGPLRSGVWPTAPGTTRTHPYKMPPISTPPAPIILTGLGTDAVNVFEDLSGASTPTPTTTPGPANPYDLLLANCSYEPVCPPPSVHSHRPVHPSFPPAWPTTSVFAPS